MAVQTYANAVDTELPGLIQGLYLVGSVALHDFHAGASDIDFVAVSSAPPGRPGAGSYVTWDQVAADPLQAAPGPHVHKYKFSHASRGDRHPVTWHTLADYWQPWWQRASRLPSSLGLACLGSWGHVWGVLGVSRLHHTLPTDRITSKRGAGEYALTQFDD
ncbi:MULTISPECIES: nucleotidyltransferase domain-containing protein [unclassified Streptomyces]|uniref:nucleotidyltransferase domain-containing protein n=1 Tax=unclassified Streptomyces TaxID=2593676 RepID=UPI0022576E04|nr:MULTISPECIES: nucleotidyltransferase domain-containing protein [unclassified Streptomyces]MCX5328670.1 nucleotidyltransferase domain-containing protein [Streptomyces sp. NBC_00140]MCX5358083.1 nucleotidyltransferase domain-containing protein [Streptomyces sp. NBC_00124]